LKDILDILDDYVDKKDANGWTPLHEGARHGHKEIAEILIEKGARINRITNHGETALYLAEKAHGDYHPIVEFLKSMGGLSLGPEF
jgi:ankyrin repeat protein